MKNFKKQKGITLVALVITIIVLLILAGVTLSIVWNGGIIEKSQNAVDSYNYSSKNEEEKLSDLEEKFTQLYNERVAGKEGNGGTSGGGTGGGAEWTIDTDYGTTGLSLGDLVKPKNLTGANAYLANEKFYVIGIDGTGATQTVRLLAEKNVKTNDATEANNVQSASANTLQFDDSSKVYYTNSTTQSYIKGKVDEYVGKLVTAGLTLEDVETVEGGSATAGVKGRLMWGTNSSGEVQNVLAINATGTNSITGSTIVYGPIAGTTTKLNYWLGSPVAGNTRSAWDVYGGFDRVRSNYVNLDRSYRSSPSYKNLII